MKVSHGALLSGLSLAAAQADLLVFRMSWQGLLVILRDFLPTLLGEPLPDWGRVRAIVRLLYSRGDWAMRPAPLPRPAHCGAACTPRRPRFTGPPEVLCLAGVTAIPPGTCRFCGPATPLGVPPRGGAGVGSGRTFLSPLGPSPPARSLPKTYSSLRENKLPRLVEPRLQRISNEKKRLAGAPHSRRFADRRVRTGFALGLLGVVG